MQRPVEPIATVKATAFLGWFSFGIGKGKAFRSSAWALKGVLWLGLCDDAEFQIAGISSAQQSLEARKNGLWFEESTVCEDFQCLLK